MVISLSGKVKLKKRISAHETLDEMILRARRKQFTPECIQIVEAYNSPTYPDEMAGPTPAIQFKRKGKEDKLVGFHRLGEYQLWEYDV